MIGILFLKTMCLLRITPNYLKYNSVTVCKKGTCIFDRSIQSYSIVPKFKWQMPKARHKFKLKAKPYEELLKVLETHENLLKNNKFLPNAQNKTISMEEKIAAGIDSKSNADNPKEPAFKQGIYTISKSSKKTKSKKISKEGQMNDGSNKSEKESKNKQSSKPKKMPEQNNKELEMKIKKNYAMRSLKSYIDASVNADEVEKANQALEYHRQQSKKKNKIEIITDVDMYNILLQGWAQNGRTDKLKQLLSMMAEDNISPNLQSYAACLEAQARCKYINISEIHQIISEMKGKGFTANDFVERCVFVGDQLERIIEVLGLVDPNILLTSVSKFKPYNCTLLERLNDKSKLRSSHHINYCFQKEDIDRISTTQMQLENDYFLGIQSVDKISNVSEKTLKARNYLKECEEMWKNTLAGSLKSIKHLEKKTIGGSNRISIYPYLAVIDTEILVNLLIQEIRFLAETGEFFSLNVKALYKNIGIKVMNHYFIWLSKKNKVSDKVLFIYQKYLNHFLDPELSSKYTPREYWEYLKTQYVHGPTIDIAEAKWPHNILTYIGRYLYDILRFKISFNANAVRHKTPSKVMSQAFYTAYEGLDVKLSKQIRTHPLLCKLYRDARPEHLEFDMSLVPMVCPPRPWVKHNAGGLLIAPTPFIRFPLHAHHQSSSYGDVPPQQLYPCFDSLNSLSLCPWIINKPLLDLIIEVFRSGGNEDLDIPLNPNSFSNSLKILPSMTKKEISVIKRQKTELKKKKSETASLWFDCLYKLSIANHFRDKTFWFPHNMDFRGRVYPTPPHFNHLGSDMARSILLFAEGRPLGKNGLNWLKTHLINLTGFKKRDPHSERLKYANEMLPEILDSADRPFQGNQWWTTSDKPWQTLACCKEVASAVRSADPEHFVSHFPIHQDGSCNGLQHYAALGRDEMGANEVNLHPSEAPHDVYSGVAALVEKERLKDAKEGLVVAKRLEGFVKRKVVKQTVMTFVYGVTSYGAKLQILKQLKDVPNFPEKYEHEAASYLMKKTFFSIREMFTATKHIQDWFTDCAEQITRVSGESLEWVTPLGLPVIQPYHKETSVKHPKFCISQVRDSSFLHYSSRYEPFQLPNVKKQKNAFAPNFIHSLDSSHMMLTSLFCQRSGITYVSVHDCFWTHCATVEIMNKICREQFVSLHKEPILENLSAFFLKKYAHVTEEKVQQSKKNKERLATLKLRDVLGKVPDKGTFNLDKVIESIYFFS